MTEPEKLSGVEKLKAESHYLRGTIKDSLAKETSFFEKGDTDLLKSHGTYQQDDRDLRAKLLKEGKEKAYSLMVRSKIPGGKMTPDQYLAHDELGTKYANGTLRITTRQGIQFHGVLKKNVKTVIKEINHHLGTTIGACGDNVRNVMACPAPHHDRLKHKIGEYAKAVSDQFYPQSGAYYEIWLEGEKVKFQDAIVTKPGSEIEPIYGKTYLPRKFKIAIAFPDDNCIDVYSNDLGIVPEIRQGTLAGFNILVGGGFGKTHGLTRTYPRLASELCFVRPDDLLAIAKAIVLVQRDFGNRADRKRARMKYLIDEKGLDWFRTEVEKRFGKKTEDPHPIQWKKIERHLGWHEGEPGKWFYGLSVENGRVKDEGNFRLKSGLRAAVEKYQPDVYLTAEQDLLLYGFRPDQKKELEALLKSYGILLSEELSLVQKGAMACPALPTCGLAISESERALPAVIDDLEKKVKDLGLGDQEIIIRMTGCPNGCARPYNAELAFVGQTAGTHAVYVGGNSTGTRLNFLVADKIPQAKLSATVIPLLEHYSKKRNKGEGFGDFCFRLGADALKVILKDGPS